MEYTRMTMLPLTRALTYELMKRKRISARPIQTVELKFNAVGRGRLVSTCVEKDALTETYSCPGEGRDWASTPHSGKLQFHVFTLPRLKRSTLSLCDISSMRIASLNENRTSAPRKLRCADPSQGDG